MTDMEILTSTEIPFRHTFVPRMDHGKERKLLSKGRLTIQTNESHEKLCLPRTKYYQVKYQKKKK